jgi:hypothetical protein
MSEKANGFKGSFRGGLENHAKTRTHHEMRFARTTQNGKTGALWLVVRLLLQGHLPHRQAIESIRFLGNSRSFLHSSMSTHREFQSASGILQSHRNQSFHKATMVVRTDLMCRLRGRARGSLLARVHTFLEGADEGLIETLAR